MAKATIEVIIPDGIDLNHTIKSVLDALYLPENVTQQEYDLVESILDSLISNQNQE
jgi:hypothetical protein